MTTLLDDLQRIALIEFSHLLVDALTIGEKVRLFLTDSSYIDLWLSHRLTERFGFHWERRHRDGTFYRYDNFPDTIWRQVSTFPRHFHNGAQEAVEAASFSADINAGFRDFMRFVETKFAELLSREGGAGGGSARSPRSAHSC